jgi:hypothetical protein
MRLRATLDWSHELLPETERQLLRRLAVFPGGFTIDAATAVMTDTGFDASAVLDGIANLVAKSWVVLDKSGAAARWTLLETIRAYAFEKLVEHTETDVAAEHHALYFRDLFAPQTRGAKSSLSDEDLARHVREIDNVRAALDWSSLVGRRPGDWRRPHSRLKAACEDYLRHGVPGNCTLEPVEVEPPKLNKGEGVLDGIERLRRRGRGLKADLHRIASAPFPSSYSKQRLREMVEQLAARGTPDVTNLIEHDREIIWPTLRVQSEVHGAQRSLAFHEAIDVVGLFAAILKPAMISFLDTLVDAEKDDAAALSHEAARKPKPRR